MYRGKVIALGSPAELKMSLGKGKLLNLESPDLFGALRTLEGKPELANDVAVFGGGLHVKVDDAAKAIPEIRNTLQAAGIGVTSIEPIVPSMEDVFVNLIEREEKAAA